MNEKDFEAVCEAVHNAWWEEKARQGVTDHPDMVPYEALSESVKDYDRATVRTVLDALPAEESSAGWTLGSVIGWSVAVGIAAFLAGGTVTFFALF